MNLKWKRIATLMLCIITMLALALPAASAEIKYMPDVTAEMANYRFWAGLQKDADDVILTQEEIKAFNQDTIDASGTMVMDLKSYVGTFDGIARYQQAQNSAKADAEYYYGWTYNPKTGKLADWSYYAKMINNVVDLRF